MGSCSFTVSARVGGTSDEWIGIHTNGIHTIPMECIRNGMQWYPLQCKGLHTNAPVTAVGCSGLGKGTDESRRPFTTIPVTP